MVSAAQVDSKANKSRHKNTNKKGEIPHYMTESGNSGV